MSWGGRGRQIRLPGFKTDVKRAYLLADRARALSCRRSGRDVVVDLPARALDPDDTVVVIELEGSPGRERPPDRPGTDGRIELPVFLADIQSQMGQRAYLDHFNRTTLLTNWQSVYDYPEWMFSTAKPGTYEVRASYASMWGGPAGYEVEVDGTKLAANTEPSPSVYFPATFPVGRVDLGAGGAQAARPDHLGRQQPRHEPGEGRPRPGGQIGPFPAAGRIGAP